MLMAGNRNSGRKKKPKVVALRDNIKKKDYHFDGNPEFANDKLLPPEGLSTKARNEWNRMVTLMDEADLLSNADVDALAMYCELSVTYWENMAQLRKEGYIRINTSGNPSANPREAMANRAMAAMRSIQSEFGLTPSSRTKIMQSGGGKKKGNKFDNLEDD
jgi:P27 family predicted phage terminase small subunit